MLRPNGSFSSGAGVCAWRMPVSRMTTKSLVIYNLYKNRQGAWALQLARQDHSSLWGKALHRARSMPRSLAPAPTGDRIRLQQARLAAKAIDKLIDAIRTKFPSGRSGDALCLARTEARLEDTEHHHSIVTGAAVLRPQHTVTWRRTARRIRVDRIDQPFGVRKDQSGDGPLLVLGRDTPK